MVASPMASWARFGRSGSTCQPHDGAGGMGIETVEIQDRRGKNEETARGAIGVNVIFGGSGAPSLPIDRITEETPTAVVSLQGASYERSPSANCEPVPIGPSVAVFDCPNGPRDIVRNEVNGLLVPAGNSATPADAIPSLHRDSELPRQVSWRC